MRTSKFVVAVAALVSSCAGFARLPAAQSACASATSPTAVRMLTVAQRMVTADSGGDADARSFYKFARVSPDSVGSAVYVVTVDSVCSRVAAAYRTAISDSSASGPVYVVAVGPMYWVYDPQQTPTASSEFRAYVSLFADLTVAAIGAA